MIKTTSPTYLYGEITVKTGKLFPENFADEKLLIDFGIYNQHQIARLIRKWYADFEFEKEGYIARNFPEIMIFPKKDRIKIDIENTGMTTLRDFKNLLKYLEKRLQTLFFNSPHIAIELTDKEKRFFEDYHSFLKNDCLFNAMFKTSQIKLIIPSPGTIKLLINENFSREKFNKKLSKNLWKQRRDLAKSFAEHSKKEIPVFLNFLNKNFSLKKHLGTKKFSTFANLLNNFNTPIENRKSKS